MSEQQNGSFSLETLTEGTESGGNDIVSTLVGEGKKYKTIEDLAKSRLEAETFIDRLKTENKAYREALLSGDSEAATATRTAATLTQGDPATQQQSNQSPKQSSLSKEEVLDLVEQRDKALASKGNISQFNSTVSSLFGEKATAVVSGKLTELGVSPKEFAKLVEQSPKAAMAMLGIREESQRSTASVGGTPTVNTGAYFANSDSNTENWTYFQKMRKELKQDYYRPEVQQRVIAARKKLGDDFWK